VVVGVLFVIGGAVAFAGSDSEVDGKDWVKLRCPDGKPKVLEDDGYKMKIGCEVEKEITETPRCADGYNLEVLKKADQCRKEESPALNDSKKNFSYGCKMKGLENRFWFTDVSGGGDCCESTRDASGGSKNCRITEGGKKFSEVYECKDDGVELDDTRKCRWDKNPTCRTGMMWTKDRSGNVDQCVEIKKTYEKPIVANP